MRRGTIRRKVIKGQGGFTLVEVLVTMLMMVTVMFALYSIFDMSLRVFSFGNDKVEAVENARLGLERMEREIRAAYPVDKENDEDHLFFSPGSPSTESFPGSDEITFGNDTNDASGNSDREIELDEEITYSLAGSTLQRNGDPVVEYVEDLTFDYLDESGCVLGEVGCPDEAEENVDIVRITLAVDVDERTQTLNTDVALRNRSE